jgi:hypothetical protein
LAFVPEVYVNLAPGLRTVDVVLSIIVQVFTGGAQLSNVFEVFVILTVLFLHLLLGFCSKLKLGIGTG